MIRAEYALQNNRWLYILSGLYLLVVIGCIYIEMYWGLLLPMVLVVVWSAIFKPTWLWYFIVLTTPLSINLEEMEIGGIGMYLPTEPLLAGLLVLFIFKLLSGKSIDSKIMRHPISLLLYGYLGWMAFTCISSELPLVSVKYLATRMWFIASFYFLAVQIFSDKKNLRNYLLAYLFPLTLVIIYTVVRHSQYGFDKDSSHWVMEPLFKDHTSYGAVLAMFFPIAIGLLILVRKQFSLRLALWVVFVILVIGLVLSYTRAAWISIAGAAVLLAAMLLRVPFRYITITVLVAGTILFLSWDTLQVSLSRNKQESSDKLEEHVSSISNVSSDASNLERLNRWHCAIEMFKERPLTGWGPGTYQFVYAPFQRSKDRTIISTNQGDGGNAHSEYLGPLCEQGVAGMLLFVALLLSISSLAFRLFFESTNRDLKIIIVSVYLGLTTYFIHGVLNNFLDTDKASVPFWGFIAILVSIDIYHSQSKAQSPTTQETN
jgi:O-antigen ligase